MPVTIDYLGEGASDEAIARKLIMSCTALPGVSYRRPQAGAGKQSLDKRLNGLNEGAKYSNPVLVLRDLDRDAQCPSQLVLALIPERHPHLLLRICVREVETWLMADVEAYARYCGLSVGQIPKDLEAVGDPKQLILTWVANSKAPKLVRHINESRSRGVPDWASLGSWHSEFANRIWDPSRAAASKRASSLSRAIKRIEAINKEI